MTDLVKAMYAELRRVRGEIRDLQQEEGKIVRAIRIYTGEEPSATRTTKTVKPKHKRYVPSKEIVDDVLAALPGINETPLSTAQIEGKIRWSRTPIAESLVILEKQGDVVSEGAGTPRDPYRYRKVKSNRETVVHAGEGVREGRLRA